MQMLTRISKLILIDPWFWRILGFVSSIVAFTCFAQSPSFHDLFGRWNLLKGVIYSVVSLILTTLMLLIKKCTRFSTSVLVRANVVFLVMMLTSLCSIWQDRVSQKESDENGSRGRILNFCSFGAFGFMSLSLSRQLQLGFEVGISNFLLCSFLVLLMKMNFKLAPLAAILCYLIINIRSFSDYFMEKLELVHSSTGSKPKKHHHPHKDRLEEYAIKTGMSPPNYCDTKQVDYNPPEYVAGVRVGGKVYVSDNVFSNVEDAEEDIAKLAFKYITTGIREEGIDSILEEWFHDYYEDG